jgi:hypothetical protein
LQGSEAQKGTSPLQERAQALVRNSMNVRTPKMSTDVTVVDVALLLQSEEPLFERALLTGGSSLLLAPITEEAQELVYSQIVEALGLDSTTTSDRIHGLRTIPVREIMSKMKTQLSFRPMIDGNIVPFAPTYAMVSDRKSGQIGGKSWLKGLLIGDCQFDASVAITGIKPHELTLVTRLRAWLSSWHIGNQEFRRPFPSTYGTTSETTT